MLFSLIPDHHLLIYIMVSFDCAVTSSNGRRRKLCLNLRNCIHSPYVFRPLRRLSNIVEREPSQFRYMFKENVYRFKCYVNDRLWNRAKFNPFNDYYKEYKTNNIPPISRSNGLHIGLQYHMLCDFHYSPMLTYYIYINLKQTHSVVNRKEEFESYISNKCD